MLHLNKLIEQRKSQNIKMHQNINPQFAKVLSTIGFDQSYVKAKGVSVWDQEGHEYYDFLSGYGVFSLGRNHPKLNQCVKEVMDADLASLIQMEAPILSGILAEKLIQIFGHNVRDTVYFTNSGTEAVETAIKFVRGATGRQKILNLIHGFHGLTTGSLSVNGNQEFRQGFGPLLPNQSIALNNLDALERLLSTKEFAAFIFEPVQGKGVFIPDQDYLKQAIALCHKYGTLTIADEVQSGMGRTGKWLACEHFDAEPDIICLSKALGGGIVPVGAVVYKRKIYHKVFSSMDRCVVHSSTFGQNNLAMACGLATLDVFEQEKLLDNCQKTGHLLIENLNALKQKHDWIKEVRGKGLMIGIEFKKPESGLKKKMVWDMAHKIDKGLFGELVVMRLMNPHHFITQVSGHHQDIIKLLPPLIINQSHADAFVLALDQVLEECDQVTGPMLKMSKNLAKHMVKK